MDLLKPSFQDIDSSDLSSDEANQESILLSGERSLSLAALPLLTPYATIAEAAFGEEEINYMLHMLRERGLFYFIK